MWGGYQFDEDGNVLTDKEGSLRLAKYATAQQLASINIMRTSFSKVVVPYLHRKKYS